VKIAGKLREFAHLRAGSVLDGKMRTYRDRSLSFGISKIERLGKSRGLVTRLQPSQSQKWRCHGFQSVAFARDLGSDPGL